MRFIWLVLLFVGISLSQDWLTTRAITETYPTINSNTDSVYLGSDAYLYMEGDETYDILVPTKGTEGRIRLWGVITNTSGGTTDTVLFKVAPYSGDLSSHQSGYSYSWTLMTTVSISVDGTSSFDVWPMSDDTLKASFCSYFVIRIEGINNHTRKMFLKIERLEP